MNASRITFRDVYFTREFKRRFVSSLSDEISLAIICSPFFDKLPAPFGDLIGFCTFLSRRGTEKIQIITRPPGSDPQALPLSVAKLLAARGVDIFIRATPYLHAKMYHLEYSKGYFRTFIGSANFTLGGFERNHEIVTEVEGVGSDGACHREIARMQATGGAETFNRWIIRGQPKGEVEQT